MLKKITKKKDTRKNKNAEISFSGGINNQRLTLNKTFYDTYFKDRRYVEFYVDAEDKVIGLKPIADRHSDAYTVSMVKGNYGGYINIRILVEDYGVRMEKGKLKYDYNKDDDMILIKVNGIIE